MKKTILKAAKKKTGPITMIMVPNLVGGNTSVSVPPGNVSNMMKPAGQTLLNQAPPTRKSGISIPQMTHSFDDPQMHQSANTFPLPTSFSVGVASAVGAGALPTEVFLLNNDRLNNITNNGSGAGSVTYTFQDGFQGNVVSDLLAFSRAGVGAIIYGVAIRLDVLATPGTGDPFGLGLTNPAFLTFGAFGRSVPLDYNVNENQTRMDFDNSIEVVSVVINFTRFSQFAFTIPIGDTATVTMYTTPNWGAGFNKR